MEQGTYWGDYVGSSDIPFFSCGVGKFLPTNFQEVFSSLRDTLKSSLRTMINKYLYATTEKKVNLGMSLIYVHGERTYHDPRSALPHLFSEGFTRLPSGESREHKCGQGNGIATRCPIHFAVFVPCFLPRST
jgi:hypothetical protein